MPRCAPDKTSDKAKHTPMAALDKEPSSAKGHASGPARRTNIRCSSMELVHRQEQIIGQVVTTKEPTCRDELAGTPKEGKRETQTIDTLL